VRCLETLDELNDLMHAAYSPGGRPRFVDLAQVTLVDSLTLGALTAAAKRVRAGDGSFRIVGASVPELRRAFEITTLDRYLLFPPRT
jgi:anti-anti-sigma factor